MPNPHRAPVLVLGRYAGTVGVIADLLTAAGVAVHGSGALDTDGADALAGLLVATADAVAVVTIAPSDPVLPLVLERILPDRVVAVTWHPVDERPDLPEGVTVVAAGRIHADLPTAISTLTLR
ncbi:hypothetical protein BH23ACT9_BH23ACT9_28010 [soil metagenome]